MKRLLVIIMISAVAVLPGHAAAHVLLEDASHKTGAVLHINPNDDPVAGEVTQLFFDIQDQASDVRLPAEAYQLTITDETGKVTTPSVHTSGKSVEVTYVFDYQGLYGLELKTKDTYQAIGQVALKYSLRVSRGPLRTGGAMPHHSWADVFIVLSAVSMLLLVVILYNNLTEIRVQSRW